MRPDCDVAALNDARVGGIDVVDIKVIDPGPHRCTGILVIIPSTSASLVADI